MKKRYLILLLVLACISLPLAGEHPPASAQSDDACPALVTEALARLETACAATGRNELCYGNTLLSAAFWAEVAEGTFDAPEDIVNVGEVQTVSSAALNLEDQFWGLGLMRIQADIPDTLPGQAVSFLLMGEVEVENAVSPDQQRQPVEPVEVTATAAANLRSGPGTNFNVAGSVPSGTALPALGRNGAGDWVQVFYENQRVWVSSGLINTSGDLSALPVLTGDAPLGPMEAFYFTTGFGDVTCAEAPPDHLLVNSPEGLAVSFTANGVEFTLGSTAALRLSDEDTMTVTTFNGSAAMAAQGFTATVPPGYEIDIPLAEDENGHLLASGAPQNFRPYDREQWSAYEAFSENMQVVEAFTVPDEPPPPPEPEELANPDQLTGPGGVPLGTGDLQVTLAWDNLADMDLHVIEPGGTEIFFANRNSASGGQLDVDSNFPCGTNTFFVENVFWSGQAPAGAYTVFVDQFSTCGAGDANWTLTVRVGGHVVLTQSGRGDTRLSFTR